MGDGRKEEDGVGYNEEASVETEDASLPRLRLALRGGSRGALGCSCRSRCGNFLLLFLGYNSIRRGLRSGRYSRFDSFTRRIGFVDVQIDVQHIRDGDSGSHANHRSEGQHEAYHDAGEVGGHECVDDDEDVLVAQRAKAHEDARGEEEDEHLLVHEERRPGGRLVLGHGRDDGDVLLRVAGVPEGVEAARPRGDPALVGEEDEGAGAEDAHRDQGEEEDVLELL